MKPLFKLDPTCSTPIPVLRVNHDGSPREEDGKTFVDLEQAASASKMAVAELTAYWHGAMKAYIGEDALGETITDVHTGETKPIDLDAMSDEEINERAQKARVGHLTPDEYAQYVKMAKAFGYDLDKRECYPRRITNEDTGETEVVAIAKIEVIEERVLRSGLFDGMDGPWFRGEESEMEWIEGWPYEKPPVEGKIILHRKGMTRPRVITGTWASFAKFPQSSTGGEGKPDRFWWFKGPFMLLKCLSVQGYRAVFRDVVGNVYIAEEFNDPAPGSRFKSRVSTVTEDGDAGAAASGLRIENDEADNRPAAIAPRTIPMLKSQLALLGYTIDEIEEKITFARSEVPDAEAIDPEAFYTSIYARAAAERRGPRRHVARPAPHPAHRLAR
jgi:hypothetical protein